LDPRGYYLVLQPLQYGQNSLISGSNDQLVGAVVTFVACSTICAQSMGALITGRSTQGLAAGWMIILTNTCISNLFCMRRDLWRCGFFGVLVNAS
jgi:MFS family permease